MTPRRGNQLRSSQLHRARSVACVPDSHTTSYVLRAHSPAQERASRGGEDPAQIKNAENNDHASAAKAFEAAYGAKFPKATTTITADLGQLLACYDYPSEHWIHLRTTDESFEAGVALSVGWDGVSLVGGRGRPRSKEQGRGAGSLAAQLAP
jgi:hypothetical protein